MYIIEKVLNLQPGSVIYRIMNEHSNQSGNNAINVTNKYLPILEASLIMKT